MSSMWVFSSKYGIIGHIKDEKNMLQGCSQGVAHPLTPVSKALELLENQTAKGYHKIAVVRAGEYLKDNERSTKQPLSTFRPSCFRSILEEVQLHC